MARGQSDPSTFKSACVQHPGTQWQITYLSALRIAPSLLVGRKKVGGFRGHINTHSVSPSTHAQRSTHTHKPSKMETHLNAVDNIPVSTGLFWVCSMGSCPYFQLTWKDVSSKARVRERKKRVSKREGDRERLSGREKKRGRENEREKESEDTHARLLVCERHQRSLNNFSGCAPFEGPEPIKKNSQGSWKHCHSDLL